MTAGGCFDLIGIVTLYIFNSVPCRFEFIEDNLCCLSPSSSPVAKCKVHQILYLLILFENAPKVNATLCYSFYFSFAEQNAVVRKVTHTKSIHNGINKDDVREDLFQTARNSTQS